MTTAVIVVAAVVTVPCIVAVVLGKAITRADQQAGITRDQQDAAYLARWGKRHRP